MSEIVKTFENFLKSNLSCDIINEKMKKLSKYKLDEEKNEEKINYVFMDYCSTDFYDEILSIDRSNNENKFLLYNEKLFKISHQIIINKEKNKDKSSYESIELFYQTFFFYEFSKENNTNDFTFYTKKIPENLINQGKYETYLFNIGCAILSQKDKEQKLMEILFCEETPEFLKNIILVCVQYIRATKKNVFDFIKLCVPSLNHYNLYYLCQKIKTDLNYQFSNISEINYNKLEKVISCYNNKNIIEEKPVENFINLKIQKTEAKIFKNLNQEEISKYFNFPNDNEEGKILDLFTSKNLKNNKDKFLRLIKSNKEEKYKIIYDKSDFDEKLINAFSFVFLLKYKLISKIDEHFFQIFNFGNIKIEIFSFLLSKYLNKINQFLNNSLSKEKKKELSQNSGFYKLNNEYVLLINVDEDDEKVFYLKANLGKNSITSLNKNENFKAYQINKSDYSSLKDNSEINEFCNDDIQEEALYNFGNYSFENDLRTFIKNYTSDNKKVYELPRLYFLLNYCIPTSENEYLFITNVKSQKYNNNSYGYSELDFVLKNESNEDIIINPEFLPYKEKLFMIFPKGKINNNKNIILKQNSVIFFEFKVSFPQYYWKDKFNIIFKKIKKFLEIYHERGIYKEENIQIFFVYDNIPDIYYIKDMKSYINKNFSAAFSNFEFGIYYFSRGINIINNQNIEKKLNDNIQRLEEKISNNEVNMKTLNIKFLETKTELDKTKNILNEFFNLLGILPNKEIKQELQKLKNEYNNKKK